MSNISCHINICLDLIDGLKETIPGLMKEAIDEAMSSSREELNSKQLLLQEYQAILACVICCQTTRPPLMISNCCCSILGCKECIETWYNANSTCPKCRTEHSLLSGYLELKGFEDVLRKAAK
jgi:hypothetical protein